MTDDEKWNAVVLCNSDYDRVFYYGVQTTGIVCRPSCKSKTPKREHVKFFDRLEHAYAFGLRPCKRCKPDQIGFHPTKELIERAKVLYDEYYQDRERLAGEINQLEASKGHLIQAFHDYYGITPGEYINQLRVTKAKQLLLLGQQTILQIALEVGFGSLSAFYDQFKKRVGMTPKEFITRGGCS